MRVMGGRTMGLHDSTTQVSYRTVGLMCRLGTETKESFTFHSLSWKPLVRQPFLRPAEG